MATLAEKLQLTLDCKNEIKTVMNEKLGLEVTDSTPLSEYATKLKTVKVGSGDSGSTKIPAFAMVLYTSGTGYGDGVCVSSGTIMSINPSYITEYLPSDEHNFKFAMYTRSNDLLEPFVADVVLNIKYYDSSSNLQTKEVSLAESNEFCLYDVYYYRGSPSDQATIKIISNNAIIAPNLYAKVTSFVKDSES